MKSGAELIAEERQRQIEQEGWTAQHDDNHEFYELSAAAVSYLQIGSDFEEYIDSPPQDWPFDPEWWKPSQDEIRNLVRAGALIAAEIDRLQRAKRNA